MVRAIRDRRKTQTRRIAQNVDIPEGISKKARKKDGVEFQGITETTKNTAPHSIGDELYIKEQLQHGWNLVSHKPRAVYTADDLTALPYWEWKNAVLPSIFMPQKAARFFIRIEDLRLEKLQNITEDDIIEEGAEYFASYGDDPQEAFENYINDIHGPGTWESNPWVWVFTFRRIESYEP